MDHGPPPLPKNALPPKKPSSRWGRSWVLLAAAAGCDSATATDRILPPKIRPVRYAEAEASGVGAGHAFTGRVRASQQPALSFQVPGRVEQVLVEVGDSVKKGQVLAVLDRADFATRVASARAAVAQAEAEARRARRDADRNERLFSGSAVSEADRDRSRDIAVAAEAQLERLRQELALADRELGYTRLVARAPGTVVERRLDPGVNVSAGQPVLHVAGGKLEIQVDVPETMVSAILVGSPAQVRLPALGEGRRSALVTRVAHGLGSGRVLYPVFLSLDVEADPLAPGMAAEVFFPPPSPDAGPSTVRVPVSAVVSGREGAHVFLLVEDKEHEGRFVAERRPVDVLRIDRGYAHVTGALERGAKVATAGVHHLFAGEVVRLARLAPLVFEGVHSPDPTEVSVPVQGVERP